MKVFDTTIFSKPSSIECSTRNLHHLCANFILDGSNLYSPDSESIKYWSASKTVSHIIFANVDLPLPSYGTPLKRIKSFLRGVLFFLLSIYLLL